MTDAERKIWEYLQNRHLGLKFRRQQPIGNYIVDFVCFSRKMIIEIDGSQHIENKEDIKRDGWFSKNGYTVIRFWNNEVLNKTTDVLQCIYNEITKSPSP
jgi:very-short-patch-repair endonuclease